MIYDIEPVARPRMTRSDKWNKRPIVQKYWAFKDECQLKGVNVEPGDNIVFVVKMPKSWPKYKKEDMDGEPHTQRPDLDNFIKGILDAVLEEDSHIWNLSASKIWGKVGQIIVERNK